MVKVYFQHVILTIHITHVNSHLCKCVRESVCVHVAPFAMSHLPAATPTCHLTPPPRSPPGAPLLLRCIPATEMLRRLATLPTCFVGCHNAHLPTVRGTGEALVCYAHVEEPELQTLFSTRMKPHPAAVPPSLPLVRLVSIYARSLSSSKAHAAHSFHVQLEQRGCFPQVRNSPLQHRSSPQSP
eukprot:3895748-Amphidinium_carterae.1